MKWLLVMVEICNKGIETFNQSFADLRCLTTVASNVVLTVNHGWPSFLMCLRPRIYSFTYRSFIFSLKKDHLLP